MKNILRALPIGLAAFLILSFSGIVSAQDEIQKRVQTKTIFDYKSELRLSDNQEKEIKKILSNLNKEQQLKAARLVIVNSELDELIEKEEDLIKIKSKLKEAYDIQAESHFANIEFTRKFNKILSADQLKRWKEIQSGAGK